MNTSVILICGLVTLGTLVYVFYIPGQIYTGPTKTRIVYLRERKEAVYDNLRDLNFEYKAGKFPDSDYQEMKTSLEDEAAAILAEIARLEEVAATGASTSRQERSEGLNLSLKAAALILTLTFGAFASAETLTGTVKNGTTNKPAAGDDVILIKLANGMEEAARTKADSKGNFKFTFDDVGPHLIRAVHQGVTYHHMAPPGTTSVDLDVFDVAKKIDGLSVTADVMRFQVENGQLEVVRLFAVNNESKPPKTQMNDHNFEFYLPEGAKVAQGMAKTANGNPLNAAPVPQADKGRYAFIFPLRPGETQFQVQYTVPYSGSATIDPKSPYGMQHFVVMVPKTMQFEAGPGAHFDSMNDPQQTDAIVQVAAETKAGQPLSFKISGTGVLAANTAPEGSTNGGAMGGGQAAARKLAHRGRSGWRHGPADRRA